MSVTEVANGEMFFFSHSCVCPGGAAPRRRIPGRSGSERRADVPTRRAMRRALVRIASPTCITIRIRGVRGSMRPIGGWTRRDRAGGRSLRGARGVDPRRKATGRSAERAWERRARLTSVL